MVAIFLCFWRSTAHSAKFGQIDAAVTIIAAGSHVPQFSEAERQVDFWQITVEMDILLLLKGGRVGDPMRSPLTKLDQVLAPLMSQLHLQAMTIVQQLMYM